VGRHRHVITVRADGLATVLGPLMQDSHVVAAALADIDSGMVLDACTTEPAGVDLEVLGAGHAELMRAALGLLRLAPTDDVSGAELALTTLGGRHHILRVVPDPHGDRLVLSVVVDGSRWSRERIRRRLRRLSVGALTAGPSMTRRPGPEGWLLGNPGPPRFEPAHRGAVDNGSAHPRVPAQRPADPPPPDDTATVAAGTDEIPAVPASTGEQPAAGPGRADDAAARPGALERPAAANDGSSGPTGRPAPLPATALAPDRRPAPPAALPPPRSAVPDPRP
jgi:hypothetical protein